MISHRPPFTSAPSRRLIQTLIVSLIAATLFFDAPPSPANATGTSSRLPRTQEFAPDFTRGEERGIGLRFRNLATSHYLDMRLSGFRGTDARVKGTTAEYDASSRVKVVYESHQDSVKETIISSDRSLSEFRFQISTSGLERRTEDGRTVFAPKGQPAMFRLGELVTFDSAGASIPGTLTAEDDRLLIRLDKTSLKKAVLPVMIDPTIEGVAAGSTSGAQGRRIVELQDGTLAFFFRHLSPDGPKVVYRLSEDKGETWGTTKTVGDGGPSSDISVVHTQEDDVLIAYASGTQELPRISYRELERTEDGFDAGLERIVTTAGVWWRPIPTLIERSQGPLGKSVAVGFRQWSPVANRFEYAVATSDNSGISWIPTTCATTTGVGTIAKEGSRLLCIPVTAQNASFKERGPAGWGSQTTIISNTLLVGDAPSHIHTDDGRLHLVFTNSGSVYYTQMTPGAASFTSGKTLGPGQNPVITTNGTSLFVHAMWLHNSSESRITSYVATDGQNFNPGKPLGGDTFDYVLDKNQSWHFQDETGDGLFGLVSGTAMIGNQIGSSSVGHLIDDMSEKLSFSFVASSAATITSVDLWTTNTATGSLTYVIGIKPDDGGVPGDEWVDGKQNGVTVPGNSPRQMPAEQRFDFESMEVPLPEIPLLENTRYHLVIEPLSGVSALSNASFQSVGTAPGATETYKVLDHSSSWNLATNEVPRFRLNRPTGVVLEQLLAPGTSYPILEYQGAGQKFTASQAITPTDLRLHFSKVGNPTSSVTAKILDSGLNTLWQSTSFTPSTGWMTITATSPPQLTSGSNYRLVLESENRDLNNYWQLTTSGDSASSWLGTSSTFSRWLDRPGIADRTPEASDTRSGPWDFWAFNTSVTDTLLVGDDKPFDFVILNRQAAAAGASFTPSYKYWNGSTWTTLTTERDGIGTTYESSEFDPPTDWATTTVDGKAAYWVEVKANADANVLVERVTAIRNLKDPSVAPRVDGSGPLSMSDLSGMPATEVVPYDVIAPTPAFVDVRPNPFIPTSTASGAFVHVEFNEPLLSSATLNSTTQTLVTVATQTAESLALTWSGQASGGGWVPNGVYSIKVIALDQAGNRMEQSEPMMVGPGPQISSVATEVEIGDKIEVVGQRLASALSETKVHLGSRNLLIEGWTESAGTTTITAYVPLDIEPGDHLLVAYTAGTSSNVATVTVTNRVTPKTNEPLLAGKIAVKLAEGATITATAGDHGDPLPLKLYPDAETDPDLSHWYSVTVTASYESDKIEEYADDARVEWAEFFGVLSPAAEYPNDARVTDQWAINRAEAHHPDIDAPQAWGISTGSSGETIAIIDSGIAPHSDLDARNTARNGSVNPGRDYTGSGSLGDGCASSSIGPHGTQVAGLSSAVTNNGIGIAGAAWRGNIRPYKVFGTVQGACKWTSETPLPRVIYDAAIDGNWLINIASARAGESPLKAESEAIRFADSGGHMIVAAAGNHGTPSLSLPAAYEHVISAGAMTKQGTRWTGATSGSAFGNWVDLYAPGADVLTTSVDELGLESYASVTGTSAASAYVAGVAMLLKGGPNDLTNTEIYTGLLESSRQWVPVEVKMINAYHALFGTPFREQPLGRFFKEKETGDFWFIDLDYENVRILRPVNPLVLKVWGEIERGLLILNSHQAVDSGIVDQTLPLGVRPGTLIQLTGTDSLQRFELISSDSGPKSTTSGIANANNGRWTRGKRRDVTTCMASLGYKPARALLVDPALLDRLHGASSQWTDCTRHPNGTFVANTDTVSPKVWMIESDDLRLLVDTAGKKDFLFKSWGLGSYRVFGSDSNCDEPTATPCYYGDNDTVIPTAVSAIEISGVDGVPGVTTGALDEGPLLGFRPGSLVYSCPNDRCIYNNRSYFAILPDNSSDYARGTRRQVTKIGCYGYEGARVFHPWEDDLGDLHSLGSSLNC